jgi:hypothetical protein
MATEAAPSGRRRRHDIDFVFLAFLKMIFVVFSMGNPLGNRLRLKGNMELIFLVVP